ncbi:acyl-CoA dehydrogenase [Caballeronia sp. LZ033]|uniref:acyl-CoA dehydrogenase family protein n=1 Tax=Caballeronia sp. LZ033 TaxID=3038566 RepID=UPI00285937A9|nr:acyl-CoA dehydrogenase [Caballeronia sp. LZ033]MDR5813768.1 acyl-CoA dehydrogenase [Caballeronia sp. LZ033]
MDFTFSDEQQQFRDALRRYLEREYPFDARQKVVASAAGVDDKHWRAFAELGVLALPVPEAQGGFDGNPVDMLVVMQELGRAQVVEPYWATAVGIEALRLAAREDDATAAALLERAGRGEIKLAVAFSEPHARYDLFDLRTEATADGDAFTLAGTKSMVQHGAQADHWIVPARLEGEVALFIVGKDAANVRVTEYRTIDGQRAATLVFDRTPATRLGKRDTGAATLQRIADHACFLLCAEALGALDALHLATVAYSRERQQFGMPIGRFQALQHRMVDMLIHIEQARSITYLAAAHLQDDDAERRARTISAAKARIGQAARFVGQQAVQLHGGMGVTHELPAAHWFKRLSIIETTLGDVDHHLARFVSLRAFSMTED